MIQYDHNMSKQQAQEGLRSRRSTRRTRTTAITGCAVLAMAAAGCGGSADGKAGDAKLVLGVRSVSVNNAALYWAAAKGYYKNEGLDLSFKVGDAATTAQLVSGQTDLYAAGQGDLFGIANSGKQVSTIYGAANTVSAWVVTSNDAVKTPADCKSLTTATPGTVFYAWARQLESVYGVKWKLTPLTAIPAISANVTAGRTDCANGNVTYFSNVIDQGKLRVILDPTDKASRPAGWPRTGIEDVIGGLPDRLEEKKAEVQKFLTAFDKALADFMKTDSREIARTLINSDSDWAAVGSEKVLAQAISDYKPLFAPNGGYISEDTWSTTLGFFRNGGLDFLGNDPKRFEYAKTVDMSYYEEAIGR